MGLGNKIDQIKRPVKIVINRNRGRVKYVSAGMDHTFVIMGKP